MAMRSLNAGPATLSTTMSIFFGAIAVETDLRRLGVSGLRTKSAPSSFSLAPFSALRDNATTTSPIDFPSNTEATPTPPEAPVTSSTEPSRGGDGGSLHCVSACQAVRKTRGAPAVSSRDQALGIAARLAAGIMVLSARVPQASTPASERRMPTVSPTLTFSTPTPTAITFPTPSRPRMCGSGGLAGYMPWAKKASAGFSAANFISNSAWPGPGCGSGTSPNRSSSTPLYESINHARITLWYCQVRDCPRSRAGDVTLFRYSLKGKPTLPSVPRDIVKTHRKTDLLSDSPHPVIIRQNVAEDAFQSFLAANIHQQAQKMGSQS